MSFISKVFIFKYFTIRENVCMKETQNLINVCVEVKVKIIEMNQKIQYFQDFTVENYQRCFRHTSNECSEICSQITPLKAVIGRYSS